jgi:hypothetical protein
MEIQEYKGGIRVIVQTEDKINIFEVDECSIDLKFPHLDEFMMTPPTEDMAFDLTISAKRKDK